MSINDLLIWLLDLVQSVDPVTRTLIAGVAMFCETSILLGLIVPGDTIVIVSATAVENLPQYFALLVAVVLGSLAGESLGFALGRWFGPHIRASRAGRRIGETNWQRAQNYVDRRGSIAVFVSRFLPVLHSLVPLTVGMSTMSYRRFMAWTVPASVIWAVTYVTFGSLAAGSYRAMAQQLHWAGYLFVAAVAIFVLAMFLAKKFITRSESRHWSEPAEAGAPDANTMED